MTVFDAAWFERWQPVIRALLAAPLVGRWFRWVLCIRPHDVGYRGGIVRLLPHAYIVANSDGSFTADVRTHPKYAKRLYYAFRPVWWALHAWDWAVADRWAPALSCGFATLTQWPNASTDSGRTTQNGALVVNGVNVTWASIIATATCSFTSNSTTGTQGVHIKASTTSNQWDTLRRSVFLFETSALGSGAAVTAAVLSLAASSDGKTDGLFVTPNIDIYTATPASNTSLATSDFPNFGSTSQTGAPISYASWDATVGNYNAFTFNATGRGNVNRTGISKFGARNANYDVAAVAPTWSSGNQSWLGVIFADASGTSTDPKLVITYTVPLTADEGVWVKATLGGVATNITDDVLRAVEPLTWSRGITGNGPADCVAGPGHCTFSLFNGATATGLVGRYSPNHTNCLAGWTYGIPIQLNYRKNDGSDVALWTGRLRAITPLPGIFKERRVQCVAMDVMNDVAENEAVSITPQVGQTEAAILNAILDAMPTAAQPVGRTFDTALDTYDYALWNASSGTKALALLADVVRSAQGYLYPLASGYLRYENRQSRGLESSGFTFDDSNLVDMIVPSDLSNVYNHVRCVIHPMTVDASATTVLFAANTVYEVPANGSIEVWGDYSTPTAQGLTLIGGTAQVTPVAGTDYAGNSLADGSGSNQNASLSVVASAFAATVKFVIANSSGSPVYLVAAGATPKLQIRGKGIYDSAPVWAEAQSTQPYGDRFIEIDLTYQNSLETAADRAAFIEQQYNAFGQVQSVTFITDTSTLLAQALAGEIGDVVTVTESMTGVAAVDATIQAITGEIVTPTVLRMTYWTTPHFGTDALILDDATLGLLDTAALGFG